MVTNFGLKTLINSGTNTSESTVFKPITTTNNIPISDKNLNSDKNYQGAIPIVMSTAVNKIALPHVVSESEIAFSNDWHC